MAATSPDARAPVYFDDVAVGDGFESPEVEVTAEAIIAFGRDKIANFKVPRYVEIVDQFPLTGSGKVQKFKQKAYAVDKLGLTSPAP